MALITIPQAESDINQQYFDTDWLKWQGIYNKCPLFASAINTKANAVTASWSFTGENAKEATDIFNGYDGNGKQTFKILLNNMCKVYTIGGNYFGLEEYGEHENFGKIPMNIISLPPENIRINCKRNGTIKSYSEITPITGRTANEWKPQSVLHMPFNAIGAMVHGVGDAEKCEKIVQDYLQLQDDLARLYHSYVDPLEVYEDNDDPDAREKVKAQLTKLDHLKGKRRLFISKEQMTMKMFGLPQYSVLNPMEYYKALIDAILMAESTPGMALGSSCANISEEGTRMMFMGFRQMIRWNQQLMEEWIESQVVRQIFPVDTPKLNLSFGAEPIEEKFNRMLQYMQTVNAIELNPTIKGLLTADALQEMGVINYG